MKLIKYYNEKCCYGVGKGCRDFFKEYLDYQTHGYSRWSGPNGIRYYMNIDLMTDRREYEDYFFVGIFKEVVNHGDSYEKVCSTHWKYKPTRRELWRYARKNTIEKSRLVFNTGTIWI